MGTREVGRVVRGGLSGRETVSEMVRVPLLYDEHFVRGECEKIVDL